MSKKISLPYIIILVVVLVVAAYVFLFYNPMNNKIAELESQSAVLQEEVDASSAKMLEFQRMEKELGYLSNSKYVVPEYNNAQQVLSELNTILSGTTNYSVSIGDPTFDDLIARKSIELSFNASSYANAVACIERIRDSENMYLINDLNISIDDSSAEMNPTSVGMSLTCFEYVSDKSLIETDESETQE